MSRKPTFFIIVPSFNQGQFIKQTLDSILMQKGVKVHCLVKDGGSTDETVSILKKYKKSLTFTSKKDKGQTDALNQGLKEVFALSKHPQLDVVAYLNSDDYYLPQAFNNVVAAFGNTPSKMWVVGDSTIVNAKRQEIHQLIRVYKKFWRLLLSWPALMILNPIPQPSTFMRVAVAKKVGFFNQKLHLAMDYDYWLRVWKQYGRPLVLNQALAAFRVHGQSKGSKGFAKQFKEQLTVAKTHDLNLVWLLIQQFHNNLIVFSYQLLK